MTKIIGIDLGTTYSAIAQLDDLGNPEVLSSTDENRKITASTIYVSGEKVIVGDKALDALAATPKNVISETKRQMEKERMNAIYRQKRRRKMWHRNAPDRCLASLCLIQPMIACSWDWHV